MSVAATALGAALVLPAPAQAATALPARIRGIPAGTRQVIVVHAATYRTSRARLEAYVRRGSTWRRALPVMSARIGAAGFADTKVEGDRRTPIGIFPIGSTFYGVGPNPGVRYPYHRLVPGDWWNSESGSPQYNTFGNGERPGPSSEPMWQIVPQYRLLAVIGYNMPATAGRGSAIFLHQAATRGGATAGCVSLGRGDLTRTLTWLDPAAAPLIVLAPDSAIRRM